MKNIINTIILLCLISCKAQIIPLYPPLQSYNTAGAYYKDDSFDLNKFIGTWRYQDGDDSFTIILKKKTHSYNSLKNCHFDMLIGEYEYIKDGIIIVSTLSSIDNPSIGDFNHNINDGYLLFSQRSLLDSQIIEDKGVSMRFINPLRNHIKAYTRIKYLLNPDNPSIEFKLIIPTQFFDTPDVSPDFLIPDTSYVMMKQP